MAERPPPDHKPDRRRPDGQLPRRDWRRLTDLESYDGRYVTVADTARYFSVKPKTVWKWHACGLITIHRFHHSHRVDVRELLTLIECARAAGQQHQSAAEK